MLEKNLNIRCIEISQMALAWTLRGQKNLNIRCIEIQYILIRMQKQQLKNLNIRCIEIDNICTFNDTLNRRTSTLDVLKYKSPKGYLLSFPEEPQH